MTILGQCDYMNFYVITVPSLDVFGSTPALQSVSNDIKYSEELGGHYIGRALTDSECNAAKHNGLSIFSFIA